VTATPQPVTISFSSGILKKGLASHSKVSFYVSNTSATNLQNDIFAGRYTRRHDLACDNTKIVQPKITELDI
jgi:hypothetical protein